MLQRAGGRRAPCARRPRARPRAHERRTLCALQRARKMALLAGRPKSRAQLFRAHSTMETFASARLVFARRQQSAQLMATTMGRAQVSAVATARQPRGPTLATLSAGRQLFLHQLSSLPARSLARRPLTWLLETGAAAAASAFAGPPLLRLRVEVACKLEAIGPFADH